ncbi:Uncharacterized protein dnm_070960 [Desulfonema magnum]|uniref:Outer membrane lipoprotein-sorting protein n=1 Tax=Desulfonema magnum TaxID=45655 RepID=A0A975GRG2_9BACT|nr:Uncharacterized protein dnm_070960 [Desulfonema magnum]
MINIVLYILLIFPGNAFAEFYKGDTFPSDKILKNLFENIIKPDDVQFERSVGTKKDNEGNYILYYQLRDMKNNLFHNETMMVIQLDNKVWIAYPYTEEDLIDLYVIIEHVK